MYLNQLSVLFQKIIDIRSAKKLYKWLQHNYENITHQSKYD